MVNHLDTFMCDEHMFNLLICKQPEKHNTVYCTKWGISIYWSGLSYLPFEQVSWLFLNKAYIFIKLTSRWLLYYGFDDYNNKSCYYWIFINA